MRTTVTRPKPITKQQRSEEKVRKWIEKQNFPMRVSTAVWELVPNICGHWDGPVHSLDDLRAMIQDRSFLKYRNVGLKTFNLVACALGEPEIEKVTPQDKKQS